jgi:hypothetical protein
MMTFLLKIGGITYSQLGKGLGVLCLAIAAGVYGIKMKPKM